MLAGMNVVAVCMNEEGGRRERARASPTTDLEAPPRWSCTIVHLSHSSSIILICSRELRRRSTCPARPPEGEDIFIKYR
ncbi:Os01g0615850 [Oryza sativa Japonica Group]|uniref:Os01g0615850 protein n=1 Tax=Oryza sativa subsp. japonica TaxID=39947 RepID=A0A0P0V596_ORYSJ|nr:hypothetical protein EE612_004069 [Oryza sativa]BAS73162.1 Os01g0615850 [Oryza sativa Japonica Group]